MTSVLQKRLRFVIPAVLVLSVLLFVADQNHFLEIWERKTIDARMKFCRSGKAAPEDIVLILIDESSLNALNTITGRWPWPRNIHADILDFLSFCGAKMVLLDILFTENQRGSQTAVSTISPSDRRLVKSTRAAGNIIHGFQILTDHADEYNLQLLDRPLPNSFGRRFAIAGSGRLQQSTANNYYLPFPELRDAAKALGVVSFSPDPDGVYRSEKLLFPYQQNLFPALSIVPVIQNGSFRKLTIANNVLLLNRKADTIAIPLTDENEYYINMYGKFQTYSISGVLLSMYKLQQGEMTNLPVNPAEFKDKIVFIGASAAGVEDLKHTSMGSETPGVFLHASIIGNIETGDFLRFCGPVINLLLPALLISVTAASICLIRKPIFQTLTPLALVSGYLLLTVVLFKANIVLNLVLPILAFSAAGLSSFAFIGITEGKEKRKVKNILGQYVSPTMLSQVLDTNREEYLKAEVGSREVLTIFFSDIRGFTTITEKYQVETVVELLNAYLSRMVNIIFDNQGTLDKFIGDAVVAFWGAPIHLEDHHYRAVIAAIEMNRQLARFNRENQEQDYPRFDIGIGIHTGEVILGNIGSTKKLDYTVIGDSVNLASRIEGLTKAYQCKIIISHDTYIHVKDRIGCRILDNVAVKGKKKPIIIYEVVDEKERLDDPTREMIRETRSAFQAYCEQRFEEAITLYQNVLDRLPEDYLSKMFIERCSQYLNNRPPPGWDGVFIMKTK